MQTIKSIIYCFVHETLVQECQMLLGIKGHLNALLGRSFPSNIILVVEAIVLVLKVLLLFKILKLQMNFRFSYSSL